MGTLAALESIGHWIFLFFSVSQIVLGTVSSVKSFNYPQHQQQLIMSGSPFMNSTTASMFEARDSSSGAGVSSSYGVPAVGGYEMMSSAYGAPMGNSMMYKYQIYPNPPASSGWGSDDAGDEEDGLGDFDFEFPKELLDLLKLKLQKKGLKGLKGLKGAVGLFKGLFLIKKVLKIPLLPIILPLLLPLLLLKLAAVLLPLLLVLFIPFPLLVTGRDLENGATLRQILLEKKVSDFIAHFPQDILQVLEKIRSGRKGSDFWLSHLLPLTELPVPDVGAKGKSKPLLGDTGGKILKPSGKSLKNLKAKRIKATDALS